MPHDLGPRPDSEGAPPKLLTAADLADWLRLGAVSTVYRAVKAGRLPAPIYPTMEAARWRADEVLRFLEATRQQPGETPRAAQARRARAHRGQKPAP